MITCLSTNFVVKNTKFVLWTDGGAIETPIFGRNKHFLESFCTQNNN